jgi:hypothetical protein
VQDASLKASRLGLQVRETIRAKFLQRKLIRKFCRVERCLAVTEKLGRLVTLIAGTFILSTCFFVPKQR